MTVNILIGLIKIGPAKTIKPAVYIYEATALQHVLYLMGCVELFYTGLHCPDRGLNHSGLLPPSDFV